MRFAILFLVIGWSWITLAIEPTVDFVSYECSPPIPLNNFKEHFKRGYAARAVDWTSLPIMERHQNSRLAFEIEAAPSRAPKADLFMWRREGEDEFEQYRDLAGINIEGGGDGLPLTLFKIRDLNFTHYAEFGTLLSHGSRLIVEGPAALLIDSKQAHMALCKLSNVHVRPAQEVSISAPPGFKTNFRALEPWLRELLKSKSFRTAMECSLNLEP